VYPKFLLHVQELSFPYAQVLPSGCREWCTPSADNPVLAKKELHACCFGYFNNQWFSLKNQWSYKQLFDFLKIENRENIYIYKNHAFDHHPTLVFSFIMNGLRTILSKSLIYNVML
jgi:hypothetical protein